MKKHLQARSVGHTDTVRVRKQLDLECKYYTFSVENPDSNVTQKMLSYVFMGGDTFFALSTTATT